MNTFPGTVAALKKFVRQGMLLHGSPRRVKKKLVPRPGSCLTHLPANCQKGIYATDVVAIAYFCALGLRARRHRRVMSAWSQGDDGRFRFYMSSVSLQDLQPGYIYVLAPDKFESTGVGQYICRTSVEPVSCCRVLPQGFPGQILPL